MSTIDWQARVQQRLADDARSLRELVDQLAQHNVTVIEVEYDGSGDSGQVESISFTGLAGPVPMSEPAERVVEEYVDALLSCHEPGWENDEGSFGTVRINVAERSVTLEHSTRFTDYHESTIEQAL
jgi:hypothetical protein